MKNEQNIRILFLHDICRKINKIPEFYTKFARKCQIFTSRLPKIFFRDFFGGWGWEWGRATPSLVLPVYAYGWAPGLPPAKSGPDAQNLLPKICTKSPISRLIWKIDGICLALLGGFRGWPIQWNRAKCWGANPCCHGNDIWPRRGDLVAYRLVCVFVCFDLLRNIKTSFSFSPTDRTGRFFGLMTHNWVYQTLDFDYWLSQPPIPTSLLN